MHDFGSNEFIMKNKNLDSLESNDNALLEVFKLKLDYKLKMKCLATAFLNQSLSDGIEK